MQIIRRPDESTKAKFSAPLPSLISRILTARGVTCDDQLSKTLHAIHPTAELKGVNDAVELLYTALKKQHQILIVGDFDVDGATSTALAMRALRMMGAKNVAYIVPNRFEYGYGLTPEIIDEALQFQPKLIVTVDNGISSLEGVRYAQSLGLKVLVTDHHLAGSELPTAEAIVNPNQPGCEFPSKSLAGVGVIFYVMVALRRFLENNHWFEEQLIPVPNMAILLDLVALGTVADVVPLDHNNRILVEQGIRRIRAGKCVPGITALLEIGKRDPQRLVAADLGFAVGPRLNAAGRLDDMSHGIECLLTEDSAVAQTFANELDLLNAERKEIERGMQREALAALDQVSLAEKTLPKGLVLYDSSWHQGIVGILASRIKERFNRPVIAFAQESDGVLKGSARSIEGLHIRDALDAIAAHHQDVITKFGGHAMAAGLSLRQEKLKQFQQLFVEEVARRLSDEQMLGKLYTDGDLPPQSLTLETAQLLNEYGPWGQHFPEPVFDGRFEVLEQRIVGACHLKMVIAKGVGNAIIDAIAFNVDLEKWPNECRHVDLVYRLNINHYRGVASPQLLVEYLEPAEVA